MNRLLLAAPIASLLAAPLGAAEPERAMFGAFPSRNQVSTATGLPAKWDTKTGMNVKWTAKSGSQSYAGPVVTRASLQRTFGADGLQAYFSEVSGGAWMEIERVSLRLVSMRR